MDNSKEKTGNYMVSDKFDFAFLAGFKVKIEQPVTQNPVY
jgi:hypothetical protein